MDFTRHVVVFHRQTTGSRDAAPCAFSCCLPLKHRVHFKITSCHRSMAAGHVWNQPLALPLLSPHGMNPHKQMQAAQGLSDPQVGLSHVASNGVLASFTIGHDVSLMPRFQFDAFGCERKCTTQNKSCGRLQSVPPIESQAKARIKMVYPEHVKNKKAPQLPGF